MRRESATRWPRSGPQADGLTSCILVSFMAVAPSPPLLFLTHFIHFCSQGLQSGSSQVGLGLLPSFETWGQARVAIEQCDSM